MKKNMNWKKYAGAAMAAAMIPAAMAPIVSEAAAPETVEIFENVNFEGGSVTLNEKLNKNGLTSYFYWEKHGTPFEAGANDSISSVRVPAGYVVTLFEKIEGRGDTLILTEDTSFVGEVFNDKASSAKVEKIQDVKLFEDANSKGKSFTVAIKDENLGKIIRLDDLESLGNDTISSVQIPAGYTVTLFEHYDGQGESVKLEKSSDFLSELNDQVSAIKIEKNK